MYRTGHLKRVLVTALEGAGFELCRRAKHDVLRRPEGGCVITMPRKLDDRALANRILKTAGIDLKV